MFFMICNQPVDHLGYPLRKVHEGLNNRGGGLQGVGQGQNHKLSNSFIINSLIFHYLFIHLFIYLD